MRNLIKVFALMAIIGLSSCEKLVTNIDPPKTEKKMVMFSFLSPEEKIRVELSWSAPVFGSSGFSDVEYEPNATVVVVGSNGSSDTLEYDALNSCYISNKGFRVQAGLSYTVSARKGNLVIKGSTTIPSNRIDLNKLEYQRVYDVNSGNSLRIKSEWNDPGNGVFYYRTYNEFTYVSEFSGDTTSYGLCGKYVQNTGKEGTTIINTCESYDNSMGSGLKSWVDSYLVTCDKAYFEYHKRRENYYSDDPFSEPFPQYTNVEGGLGVIGSFRKSVKSVSLN